MMFNKNEKVFSLSATAAAVPHGDLTALWEEFYCYLLVAGLYKEGEPSSLSNSLFVPMASDYFTLPTGAYNPVLASMIAKGLKKRYDLLAAHGQLSDSERTLLTTLGTIFTHDPKWFYHLTGKDIVSVAYRRSFSEPMKIIAHYLAIAFGQTDYPTAVDVPRLYLSVFGNIHLAKADPALVSGPSDDRVTLEAPRLRYGMITKQGDNVTALWSLLSAQIDSFMVSTPSSHLPGDQLGDRLGSVAFLTYGSHFDAFIPLPTYASSLSIQQSMGLDGYNPIQPSASFYRDFLYGSLVSLTISRQPLLMTMINLMMEKMGEPTLDHLFSDRSFYRTLTKSTLDSKTPKRPALFRFALEALTTDDQDQETQAAPSPSSPAEKSSAGDLSQDEGGYDPSTPPPIMPVSDPAVDTDTIDLISFTKTGEGVNEDLYRQAVVALNDRLQQDESLPVTAEVKDALNYWVNGFLYRTAIQATKDQLQFLHLHHQVKIISTKG